MVSAEIDIDDLVDEYDTHIGKLTRELMVAKAQIKKLTAIIAEDRLAQAGQAEQTEAEK